MTRDIKIFPEGEGDGFPKIDFTGSGAGASAISLKVLADSTLSFEGSEGQLFSITDNLSEGVIFSVADVGGLPLLEVDADGTVLLARQGDNVGIGVENPTEKLEVSGNGLFSGNVSATNINNLQSSATDHETRIDILETDISLAEADITNLEASATDHESRISTLESAPGGTYDHGSLTGLSDDDHTQYVLATGSRSMNSLSVTGNISVTGTVDGRDIAADGTKLDNHVASGSVHFTEASIHHGSIAGLGDDDHTQYVLATGSRSMNSLSVTGNISVTGTVDGRDIAADGTKLDNHVASGSVHFTEASIHHGSIAGLGDDDHTQYVLATGSRSMNSLSVTGNISVTGTVDGRDIAADGTKLDNHVASGSVHFTVASIDHGSIAGLGDDDHTQYLRADGTRALTGNISAGTNRITNLGDPVGTQDAVTAAWALTSFPLLAQNLLDLPDHDAARDNLGLSALATVGDAPANGNIYGRKDNTWTQVDHGSIDGLDDDDHTQYVLASGARDITGDQRIDGALDVGNVSATWENLALDVVWDHLLPHDQNGNWNAATVNGGSAYQQNQGGGGTWFYDTSVNPNANSFQGVMTVSNGNTTTSGTAGATKYHTNPSTQLMPGATHYFRVATGHDSSCHIRFGLVNGTLAATATPIRACYAEFKSSIGPELRFITDDDGTTQTTTTTTLTVSTSNMVQNFWWFAIKVTDEGSGNIGVGLYDVDGGGTLLAKHTTNLPDVGSDRAMRAFIQCISLGATFRGCFLDIYGLHIPKWLPPTFVH